MKRILIVDDDPDIAAGLATLLALNHETAVGSTGFEALQLLSAGRFDVVLLDLRMPGLDGAGFVGELRRARVPVPIILMSASSRLREEAAALGIRHYLPKPFDLEDLERLLKLL